MMILPVPVEKPEPSNEPMNPVTAVIILLCFAVGILTAIGQFLWPFMPYSSALYSRSIGEQVVDSALAGLLGAGTMFFVIVIFIAVSCAVWTLRDSWAD